LGLASLIPLWGGVIISKNITGFAGLLFYSTALQKSKLFARPSYKKSHCRGCFLK